MGAVDTALHKPDIFPQAVSGTARWHSHDHARQPVLLEARAAVGPQALLPGLAPIVSSFRAHDQLPSSLISLSSLQAMLSAIKSMEDMQPLPRMFMRTVLQVGPRAGRGHGRWPLPPLRADPHQARASAG
jgi:hypothetical protein